MKKSRGSKDFLDFGEFKLPFKVTFRVKHFKCFDTSYSLLLVLMFILIEKTRASENFFDFIQLKVPQNPLEPAKCIF